MDDELEFEDYEELGAQPLALVELGPQEFTLTVAAEESGKRLDAYLAGLPAVSISRTLAQRLIDEGEVRVGNKQEKASYKLHPGEVVSLNVPMPVSSDLLAEDIPLNIVYEDGDIIVVDKPAGMVVHPAPGHATGTLVNALLGYDPGLRMNGSNRPGIVHRLDKDTSGLLVVARHDAAREKLIDQMKAHTIYKEYLTLVQGNLKHNLGLIDAAIGRDPRERKRMAVVVGGREARTRYTTIAHYARYTSAQVVLETGRTHQIRVHFAYIGHPVVGDAVYGRVNDPTPTGLHRQFLHAHKLGLNLPSTGEWREFVSPPAPDLQAVLDSLTAEGVADEVQAEHKRIEEKL